MCTCLDQQLELCGRDSVCAHAQLSRVYLASNPDVMHVIKCTRLSPTLAGRAWERGYPIPCSLHEKFTQCFQNLDLGHKNKACLVSNKRYGVTITKLPLLVYVIYEIVVAFD